MTLELNYEDLKYDPSIGRAALRPDGNDWCVLLEQADATPVHRMVFAAQGVSDAIGADQLSDEEAVINFIEECLIAAGYSAVLEDDPLPRPFIGAWTLGPPENL